MTVARSFSGGTAMCYVFPVLRMKSCFPAIGPKNAGMFDADAARPLQRHVQASACAGSCWLRPVSGDGGYKNYTTFV